jgi:hypothetical protein
MSISMCVHAYVYIYVFVHMMCICLYVYVFVVASTLVRESMLPSYTFHICVLHVLGKRASVPCLLIASRPQRVFCQRNISRLFVCRMLLVRKEA